MKRNSMRGGEAEFNGRWMGLSITCRSTVYDMDSMEEQNSGRGGWRCGDHGKACLNKQ